MLEPKFLRFEKYLKFKSKFVASGHSHFFKIICGAPAAHPRSKLSAFVRVEKVGGKIYALPPTRLHSSHAFNAKKFHAAKVVSLVIQVLEWWYEPPPR